MNKTIQGVLIFVAGGAIGGCAAWFGVKTFYMSKSDQEIQKLKAFYEDNYVLIPKQSKKENETAPMVQEVKKEPKPIDSPSDNGEKEMKQAYREALKRTSYSRMFEEKEAAVRQQELAEKESPSDDDYKAPYIITVEEFGDVEPYYDKVDLIYRKNGEGLIHAFTEDHVEPGNTIGEVAYDIITTAQDGALIYVRNDNLSTDYEIEVVDVGDDDDEPE